MTYTIYTDSDGRRGLVLATHAIISTRAYILSMSKEQRERYFGTPDYPEEITTDSGIIIHLAEAASEKDAKQLIEKMILGTDL